MLFEIYSLPKSTDRVWIDLRLGTICDAVEWNYTKRFCGAGTFSLTIPRTSLFASQIEVGCMLALTNKDEVNNSEDKYEGFIVKNILRKNDTIKITGYDLNGLLLDRVTLAETQDGKDAQSGATETIVKHYVAANCVGSADADRNFPGLEIAVDKGRGFVNDAAAPRLSRVSDVVNDILGAAGMGYRIYPDFHRADKPVLVFEVLEETNRTDEQSENTRVIFAYGHGNITEMTRETGVTADRNTFYCEYDGGYVTRYDKKSAEQAAKYSGYGRREEFLSLSCELAEVEVYAEHEVADRYRETDSLEIVAGNPLDYGRVYNVGDIVTVYDRDRGVKLNSVISAVEIKKTATEHTVNITLGDAKPKPLDLLGKSGGSVAAVIRQNVGGVVSSLAPVNSYDYLSDSSIKINNTTFNVEKNAAGLITKVTDNRGNVLEPSGGDNITDIALHNAVFWATVAARGIMPETINERQFIFNALDELNTDPSYNVYIYFLASNTYSALKAKSSTFKLSIGTEALRRSNWIASYWIEGDVSFIPYPPIARKTKPTTLVTRGSGVGWSTGKGYKQMYISRMPISKTSFYDGWLKAGEDAPLKYPQFKDFFAYANVTNPTGAALFKWNNEVDFMIFYNNNFLILNDTKQQIDEPLDGQFLYIGKYFPPNRDNTVYAGDFLNGKVVLQMEPNEGYGRSYYKTLRNNLEANVYFNTEDLCDEKGNVLLTKNCDLSFFI